MIQVLPWECPLYEQVLETLVTAGKTRTSYYELVKACVETCEQEQQDEQPGD